ncbi:MAG: HD domain-containing protein [Candidatus Latescibacteria bacterium]|nr:HD domain-containing protein [Candidatus Latescibacterota bacterium]
MKIPTRQEANAFLSEANTLNPGPWFQHSLFVAQAAEAIAAHHDDLNAEDAYILGCLHDIGRREGPTDLRHILDGYRFLHDKGFTDSARICLTHSFPLQDIQAYSGESDCSADEVQFIEVYLARIEYTEYDRLLQLCDALALPTGFTLIEKRLVDVALRRGVNKLTTAKWQAFLDLEKKFSQSIGQSIYRVLPGVVENTFGFGLPE